MDETAQIKALALRQTSDTTHRYFCPECSAQRNNRTDRPLSLTTEGDEFKWLCHHCGYKGGGQLTEPRKPLRVAPPPASLDNPVLRWLSSRGITTKTALDAGVVCGEQVDQGAPSGVGFPYKTGPGKEVYAVKWRALNDKKFWQTGSANTFWQIDRIPVGSPLVITEGECDALALWQAGIPAVSVPNGAPSQVSPEGRVLPKEDKKYQYIWSAKEHLEAAPKVVIATDADAQGEALAEELARRIGRGRCWKVLWPDGCKDANDTLRKYGVADLRERIDQAQPWPVKGLYAAVQFVEGVDALYDKGLVRGQSTGLVSVDAVYTIMPGQLSIVTGVPSMGKSSFLDQVMVNLAKREGWRFAVCSFENEPRVHIAKLMQLYTGKPFFEGPTPRMTKVDKDRAAAWINEQFVFLHQGDGHQATIDDILDRLRIAVLRYGIRGAIVDPVNFIDRGKDANETDWVSEMLTKIKVFIMAHDIHFWLVAHPAKMFRDENGKYPVPGGYSISGSAHYFNKADMGVTVHRPDLHTNRSDVVVWKSRYSWIGKVGTANLLYDAATGSYFEPSSQWAPAPLRGRPPTPSTPVGVEPDKEDDPLA